MDDAPQSPLTAARPRIFYGWWIVLACFLISLYVAAIIYYGFTAFFDPLVKEFGWSYTEVSFALSLRGIEVSLLAPLVGFLVDRYGSRRLAFWGVVTVGVGFIILSFTRSLWLFYLSFILIAFGGGGCTTVVFMRVVTNWFQKKIGMALGILSCGFGASGLLIPVIVRLIDTFGWRTAVIILGLGMLAIGIPLTLVIRNTPGELGLLVDNGKNGLPAGEGPEKARDTTAAVELTLRETLKHRAFHFLTLSEAIRGAAAAAVVTHIMPYMNFLHIPRTTASLIAGLVPVLSIAGRFGFGWLSDLYDKRTIVAISYGLLSLGIFALCRVDSGWGMLLFLLLFAFGLGGAATLRGAIVRDYFGRETFGRVIGLVYGAAGVGGMVGPTLAGFVFDVTGGYRATWIGLGISSSLTVILMLTVRRPGAATASAVACPGPDRPR